MRLLWPSLCQERYPPQVSWEAIGPGDTGARSMVANGVSDTWKMGVHDALNWTAYPCGPRRAQLCRLTVNGS